MNTSLRPALGLSHLRILTALALTASASGQTLIEDLYPWNDDVSAVVANGLWSEPTTWSTKNVPGDGDRVLIPNGSTVIYDIPVPTPESDAVRHWWIRVDGRLEFDTTDDRLLVVDTLAVPIGGELEIGEETSPVPQDVKVTVRFCSDTAVSDAALVGKGLLVGGSLGVYGSTKTPYVELSSAALSGATILPLATHPTTWKAGDELLVVGTRALDAGGAPMFQDELVGLTADLANQLVVPIDTALQYDHTLLALPGLPVYRPHVANLTRSVVFETEDWETVPSVHHRGHCMMVHSDDVVVAGAAFHGLGRTNKLEPVCPNQTVEGPVWCLDDPEEDPPTFCDFPSDTRNERGRYPFHVHLAGTDGDEVLVENCVVRDSPGWGFVLHGSRGTFLDNVSYDVDGAHFVTEDGNEIGTYVGNLAVRSQAAEIVTNLLDGDNDPARALDFGKRGMGYWFQSPFGITVEGNIAASMDGAGYITYGRNDFHAPVLIPVALLPAHLQYLAQPYLPNPDPCDFGFEPSSDGSGELMINAADVPMQHFTNNMAYNCESLMEIRGHVREDDGVHGTRMAKHSVHGLFSGCTGWDLHKLGVAFEYSSHVTLEDLVVIGDPSNPIPAVEEGDPGAGFGIRCNKSVRGIRLLNGHIEGWGRGFEVPQTHDNDIVLDSERDWKQPFVQGGTFRNNLQHFEPAPAKIGPTNVRDVPFSPFCAIPNDLYAPASPMPQMDLAVGFQRTQAVDLQFASNSIGGTTVQFDASNSDDPLFDPFRSSNPPTTDHANSLPFYLWEFGDGGTGTGQFPIHTFQQAGAYKVQLTAVTVWGETVTTSSRISVSNVALDAIVQDPDFDQDLNSADCSEVHWYRHGDHAGADQSSDWLVSGNTIWTRNAGKARATNTSGSKTLATLYHNRGVPRGSEDLDFIVDLEGDAGATAMLDVEVWGLSGEFEIHCGEFPDGDASAFESLSRNYPAVATQIGAGTWTVDGYDSEDLDLEFGGASYPYIYVIFRARAFDNGVDYITLDDVTILP